MGGQTQIQAVGCTRCGAVIGGHEPLVIVDADGVRRSTLALESRAPGESAAVYHPDCYALEGAGPVSPAGGRLFTEALCGVDGSDGSFAAVEQAASLVGRGGHLTVLIVTAMRKSVGQMLAASATEMEKRANMLADRAGVSCRIEIDPARPVHKVIDEWAAGHDLLAIGAPPKSILAGVWFSGVADSAMRSRSTPLLVARPASAASRFGEHMLVASDGLGGSDALVSFASRLAGEEGAALTLIHALGRRSSARRARIDEQARSIQLEGIDGDPPLIESGSADETIIAASARPGTSLVVMSSRRRSGLSVFGSVSRRVVHHGACSVLLVPPERLL